jgi:hypothetical protein
MTPEEIQRTIEFILQHQANAAVRMDETDRRLKETGNYLRELSESTSRQILEMADSTNRLIQEDRESTNRQIREFTTSTNIFHDDVKAFIKVLVPILEIQSKRLDRLEGLS